MQSCKNNLSNTEVVKIKPFLILPKCACTPSGGLSAAWIYNNLNFRSLKGHSS